MVADEVLNISNIPMLKPTLWEFTIDDFNVSACNKHLKYHWLRETYSPSLPPKSQPIGQSFYLCLLTFAFNLYCMSL